MASTWAVSADPAGASAADFAIPVVDTVRVEGVVTDRATGEPVSGAVVSVMGTALEATTGVDGRFGLDDVPSGEAMLVVMANGFRMLRRSVTVAAPGPVEVPLDLESAGPPDGVLEMAERMPELIGGDRGLARKVVYPYEALQKGVGGRVMVRLVVDEGGGVTAPEVIAGIGSGCDEEAVRVVREARFVPGREAGRAVKVRMVLSVPFDLEAARRRPERTIVVSTDGAYVLEGQPRRLDEITRDPGTTWYAARVVVLTEPEAPASAVEQLTSALKQVGATRIRVSDLWPEGSDIFVIVEKMPELIGGLEELQGRLRYPAAAKRAGIQGRVIVQFVVDVDGSVVAPAVVAGIGGGCDEEAIRVVRTMLFRPGSQEGKPVRVKMSLPITFKLR